MVLKKVLGQLRIANLMALEYSLPTYQDLVHIEKDSIYQFTTFAWFASMTRQWPVIANYDRNDKMQRYGLTSTPWQMDYVSYKSNVHCRDVEILC